MRTAVARPLLLLLPPPFHAATAPATHLPGFFYPAPDVRLREMSREAPLVEVPKAKRRFLLKADVAEARERMAIPAMLTRVREAEQFVAATIRWVKATSQLINMPVKMQVLRRSRGTCGAHL